ncbi:uncharacterized protein LOC125775504 [Bactrocera dorsalis]|uniref:Uncharacterized protein LOC125775504 n=1 Tax=Bactrocera dorsalis TaxID=27457 RepID=A0ABM3IYS1_BACDO|nr:uncharacterized protein LOC125775504 [Bactrocera dorsalis]XP_049302122.1 uncharacterized protein LOC125775504 [Bactrocera dorsalis]
MNFDAAKFLFLNQMDSPALFDDTYLEECPTTSSIPVKEQLTFKRKKFNISGCYNSEASFSKQQGNKLPVDGNELTSRVDNMERKMDSFLKENIIQKSEEMAQQKTVRKCKVLIRKVHQSVCRLTGEEIDNAQTEIASTLPLTTLAAALEIEEKLKFEEFATATKQFVLKMKGSSDSVFDVLRYLYTDEFLTLCNWDGRGSKQPLSKFLLSNILYYMVNFIHTYLLGCAILRQPFFFN